VFSVDDACQRRQKHYAAFHKLPALSVGCPLSLAVLQGGGPAVPPCRLPGAFDATCGVRDASPQALSVSDTPGTRPETALQGETLGYPHNVQAPDKPSDPSFGEDSFSLCSASHCPSISVLARPLDTERAAASSVLPTLPFPFFPSPVIWNSQHFAEQTKAQQCVAAATVPFISRLSASHRSDRVVLYYRYD
jgi:hypothetical protein